MKKLSHQIVAPIKLDEGIPVIWSLVECRVIYDFVKIEVADHDASVQESK